MTNQLNAITQKITEIESPANDTSAPARKLDDASDTKEQLTKMIAVLDEERCAKCELCIDICPEHAISTNSNYNIVIDSNKCTGCGSCIKECPNNAIYLAKMAHRAAS